MRSGSWAHRAAFCTTFCAALACADVVAATLPDFWTEFQRARSQEHATTTLDIDNDTFLLNHSDGFYTSGLKLTRQFALDGGARAPGDAAVSYGWRIGQELYTASDINLPPAQVYPPDHPYAGWLYVGIFRERVDTDGTSLRYGVDAGCLGPCAGGRLTQTALHRATRQPLPQGWSRQVRNEPGVMLHADIAPEGWRIGRRVDLTPGVLARFGNIHTDVAGRLTLRLGQLERDFGSTGVLAFLRLEARAVAWDATLQGGFFSSDNPHVVDPKRLVGQAELGLRVLSGRYSWSLALVRTGNEIADLSNAIGAQNFARLELAISP